MHIIIVVTHPLPISLAINLAHIHLHIFTCRHDYFMWEKNNVSIPMLNDVGI